MRTISIISAFISAAALVLSGCGEATQQNTDNITSDVSSVSETSAETTVETTTTTQEETRMQRPELSKDMKLIALTFDDGPNLTTTNNVLDKLEKYNAVGTFFLIGNNITDSTERVVKRAYQNGNEIANHSISHGYMNKMTEDEIKTEVNTVSDRIEEITGERPKFFRPPYIAVNETMYDCIEETFICGYGCEDYDDNVDVDTRVEKTLAQASDGAIILLHDAQGNHKTVEALDRIIPALQDDGYTLVTVSELFSAKEIEPLEYTMYSNVLQ